MDQVYEKLLNCYESVRSKIDFVPQVALILGSGLGDFADNIKVCEELSYDQIEGFPVSTAPGHAGKFIFGYLDEVPIVCMKGRVHLYEGYDVSDVVLPTRLMHMLGAKVLFVTNASGGIDSDMRAGDFMLITDHVSSFVPNPLIGPNVEVLGTRFPDMTTAYDPELTNIIRCAAKDCEIALKEGIYVQLTGPSFETPAEIRMLARLGINAVGMSTVVETIAARHCGMRVCGISCVANQAAGISPEPLSEADIIYAANLAAPKFKRLIMESIRRIGTQIG